MFVFAFTCQQTRDSKKKIQGKTGVIYEDSMVQHKCLWDSTYPECPERFIKVLDKYYDASPFIYK